MSEDKTGEYLNRLTNIVGNAQASSVFRDIQVRALFVLLRNLGISNENAEKSIDEAFNEVIKKLENLPDQARKPEIGKWRKGNL